MLKVVGKVYQVVLRWADGDHSDMTIRNYNSYELAKKAFEKSVSDCVNEDCAQMFSDKEKHIAADGYTVDEGIEYFLVYEDGFSSDNYEEISLTKVLIYDEV